MKTFFSQRKIVFLFVLFFIVGGLVIAPKVFSQGQGVKVEFKKPLTLPELAVFVKKYDLKPTELYYQQGEINGGHTIQNSEDIDSVVKSFEVSHQKFFDVSISATEKELREAKNEKNHEMSLVLYKQLTFALEQFKKGELTIYAIELKDNDAVKKLQKLDLIVSSAVSENLKRKSNIVAKQKDFAIASSSHESWAPYGGTSEVNQSRSYHTFWFDNLSTYGLESTYEHEAQVYNTNFADYAGHWGSNMPSAYYDTPIGDSLDNFTVGTSRAAWLSRYTEYITYMELRRGTVSRATTRIKGQKGRRFPAVCHSTWCIFASATTSSMATFTAPAGMCWRY